MRGFHARGDEGIEPSLTPLVSPQALEVGKAAQVGANLFGYRPTGSLAVRVFAPGDTSCSSAVSSQVFTVSGTGPYALVVHPDDDRHLAGDRVLRG